MTKKKMMMAGMSAALVAVIGVGGTLAYLSATSNEVENTFTIGKGFDNADGQALIVDEQKIGTTERTQEDQVYENLTPGYKEVKDPTVRLRNGSVTSYVFAKITGVDALESEKALANSGNEEQVWDITGWDNTSTGWMKVVDSEGNTIENPKTGAEGDGIYVANAGGLVNLEGFNVPGYTQVGRPLFESIEMNKNLIEMPDKEAGSQIGAVTVQACAVQYSEDQMESWKDALEAITWNEMPLDVQGE